MTLGMVGADASFSGTRNCITPARRWKVARRAKRVGTTLTHPSMLDLNPHNSSSLYICEPNHYDARHGISRSKDQGPAEPEPC